MLLWSTCGHPPSCCLKLSNSVFLVLIRENKLQNIIKTLEKTNIMTSQVTNQCHHWRVQRGEQNEVIRIIPIMISRYYGWRYHNSIMALSFFMLHLSGGCSCLFPLLNQNIGFYNETVRVHPQQGWSPFYLSLAFKVEFCNRIIKYKQYDVFFIKTLHKWNYLLPY